MFNKDILLRQNLFTNDTFSAAVLENLKSHRNPFTRCEGPICLYLTYCLVVAAVRKLDIATVSLASHELEAMVDGIL